MDDLRWPFGHPPADVVEPGLGDQQTAGVFAQRQVVAEMRLDQIGEIEEKAQILAAFRDAAPPSAHGQAAGG